MTVDKIDTSSDYLTETQVGQLLRAINPRRVGVYEKNSNLKLAHVEAYELRAHLNRILGFARWSEEVTDQQLIFATSELRQRTDKNGNVQMKDGAPITYTMHTVCYRSIVRLTVCAPNGKVLAAYTEGATGDAVLSTLGDAHDMALKTSQSQAFKRCCANLGDQFGLSLYAKGSRAALVKQTLLLPDVKAAPDGVDDDVAESVPESEAVESQPDPRVTNAPSAARTSPSDVEGEGSAATASSPVAAEPTSEAIEAAEQRRQARADELRAQMQDVVENGPPAGQPLNKYLAHLSGVAMKEKLHTVLVESLISPNRVPLRLFIEECLKAATTRPAPDRRAG